MIGAPSSMVILTWLLAFGQAFFGLCSAFCPVLGCFAKKIESGQKEVLGQSHLSPLGAGTRSMQVIHDNEQAYNYGNLSLEEKRH